MLKRVLDTNRLNRQLRKLRADSTREDASRLAQELIDLHETNAIVSPVEIEVLAGVRDPQELALTEEFLSHFVVIDAQRIPPDDWHTAKRLAKHVVRYDRDVPRRDRRRAREQNPKSEARDLGDCLITAIATRLGYEVDTEDKGLRRQAGRVNPH